MPNVNLKKEAFDIGEEAMLKRESWSDLIIRLVRENKEMQDLINNC